MGRVPTLPVVRIGHGHKPLTLNLSAAVGVRSTTGTLEDQDPKTEVLLTPEAYPGGMPSLAN
jgi:hypothetical protein